MHMANSCLASFRIKKCCLLTSTTVEKANPQSSVTVSLKRLISAQNSWLVLSQLIKRFTCNSSCRCTRVCMYMYVYSTDDFVYIFTRRAYITYTPWQCFAQNISMFLLAETDRCAHLNTHVHTNMHMYISACCPAVQ